MAILRRPAAGGVDRTRLTGRLIPRITGERSTLATVEEQKMNKVVDRASGLGLPSYRQVSDARSQALENLWKI
jgi:hypothetical protein